MRDDGIGSRSPRASTRWNLFEADGQDDMDGRVTEMRDDAHESPDDPLMTAIAATLRRPVSLDPSLDERIMALVVAGPQPRREQPLPVVAVESDARPGPARRLWRWLRQPRLVALTPLGGLAAAAALATVLAVAIRGVPSTSPVATPGIPVVGAVATDQPPVQVIQFVLVAPTARSVALVGDFNDWKAGATPLHAAAAGQVWSVEVPLVPGRHRYAFVVDGEEWVPDPSAPRASGDDFGTPSSVVTVVERRS